ncbi:MAG: hypothetical protein K2X93_17455 [Candidatus Obscuribacterales bacterium]|nr:hypothetical protein [Candidatus Obscuribacterales bacterium]
MHKLKQIFPVDWGTPAAELAVLDSSSKSKPTISEVGVGVGLIVIFGSLAMFHALMIMKPQSLVSAAIYAFAAAQGFRFFGKSIRLPKEVA